MPVCHHLDVSRPRSAETGLMHGLRFDVVEERVPNQISTIDIVLWIWTALLTAEAFYQNYNLVNSRHVSHALAKILEMACMLGFLAAYFMVRVLSLQPKMVNAYTAKVLMCCGRLLSDPNPDFIFCQILFTISEGTSANVFNPIFMQVAHAFVLIGQERAPY